jgi:hypothetical protein
MSLEGVIVNVTTNMNGTVIRPSTGTGTEMVALRVSMAAVPGPSVIVGTGGMIVTGGGVGITVPGEGSIELIVVSETGGGAGGTVMLISPLGFAGAPAGRAGSGPERKRGPGKVVFAPSLMLTPTNPPGAGDPVPANEIFPACTECASRMV